MIRLFFQLKQQVLSSVKTLTVAEAAGEGPLTDRSGVSSGDEEIVKRRGKKRKGKKGGRENGREGEREFQGIPDPGETQVGTPTIDSPSGYLFTMFTKYLQSFIASDLVRSAVARFESIKCAATKKA